ncbi:MAG: hypothetical protein R2748_34105 [Bryobacterales bacterium]
MLIHVAEPAQFFEPFDKYNERWLELKLRPGRKRPPEPSFETLIAERDRLVKRHRRSTSSTLTWAGTATI